MGFQKGNDFGKKSKRGKGKKTIVFESLDKLNKIGITPLQTSKDIIDLCERELANYKVPKQIIFYKIDPNNPPMTRIGKIDKNRLKKEILADIK